MELTVKGTAQLESYREQLPTAADEARSPWAAESLTWEFVLVRENEKERKPELRVQILHTSPHNLLITHHNQHHPSWALWTVYALDLTAFFL